MKLVFYGFNSIDIQIMFQLGPNVFYGDYSPIIVSWIFP